METEIKDIKGSWEGIYSTTLTTVGKDVSGKTPSTEWKRKILIAEHSPIRTMYVNAKWTKIKSWIVTHFVRHHEGFTPFVSTRRTDRTGINRDKLLQSELVDCEFDANLQAIINISRKRLCNCASQETREAWRAFLDKLKPLQPEVNSVCVKECVYRGFCPEMFSCGYYKTEAYQNELKEYRRGINGN